MSTNTNTTTATTPKSTQAMMPLSQLRSGSEFPGGSINVRKYGTKEVDDMVASIKRLKDKVPAGIVLPLVVKVHDGHGYVSAGNRRLLGMQKVFPKTDWAKIMVPTIEHTGGSAKELSLVENVIRADLHPVNKFEVMNELIAEGATVEDIASMFLLKIPQVRQCLAIGSLHPKIRQAWIDGKIDAGGAEAFAMENDQKRQVEVFDRLVKQRGQLWSHNIRGAMAGGHYRIDQMLKVVGQDVYEKAGHHVMNTLFHDDNNNAQTSVSDIGALKSLFGNKLAEKCKALVAEGWAWAMPEAERPRDYYSWKKVDDDQKKFAGCFVGIDHQGKLHVDRGYVKPGTKLDKIKPDAQASKSGKKGSSGAADKKKQPGVISNALMQRMSEQLTWAAARALSFQPELALAAVIAGIFSGDKTVDIKENGLHSKQHRYEAGRQRRSFANCLADVAKSPLKQKLEILAEVAAQAVDLQVHHTSHPPLKQAGAAALCDVIDAKAMNKALREKFDAKDYFNSIAKPLCLEAMIEAGFVDEAKKLGGKPKADVAKFAIANVPGKGWLPKELRTKHYDGPAGKAAPKTKAAAKPQPKTKKPSRKAA